MPFWLEPVSRFGSSGLTTFIESSHLLAIPLTLGLLHVLLVKALFPRGFSAGLTATGTLSEGFVRVVSSPHYLLGFR